MYKKRIMMWGFDTKYRKRQLRAAKVPLILSTPPVLALPERLFATMQKYISVSFDAGLFVSDANNVHGRNQLVGQLTSENPSTFFWNRCMAAVQILGNQRYSEAEVMLVAASACIQDVLKHEPPDFLNELMNLYTPFLDMRKQDITDIFLKQFAQMSVTTLLSNQPFCEVFALLGLIRSCQLRDVLAQSQKSLIDSFERRLGTYHEWTLRFRRKLIKAEYFRFRPSHAEILLRRLLCECESCLGPGDLIVLIIKFDLSDALMLQNRFAEAEEITQEVTQRAEANWYPGLLMNSFDLLSSSQHHQGKCDLAESSLKRSIHLGSMMNDWQDGFVIHQVVRLENWLREWGRHEEASQIRESTSKFVERLRRRVIM